MNGMIFRSFRKRNSSQKNTNTVHSEYSYAGIVPKERALKFHTDNVVIHKKHGVTGKGGGGGCNKEKQVCYLVDKFKLVSAINQFSHLVRMDEASCA